MEEGKNGKNGLGIVICLFIILILILALIGMWCYYNIMQKSKVESGNTTNLTSQYTNNNTNSSLSNNQGTSLKIDDNKAWVYDAEYEKNVTANSYVLDSSQTLYAKDIVVPFININSSYAKDCNSDIKEVFIDAVENYNKGVSDKRTYVGCSYEKYINNDKLSIALSYGVGSTAPFVSNFYTYNINLKTGNKLSFEELYTSAGFDSNNIDDKVEESITKYLKERVLKDQNDYEPGTNFETYNNQSINNYKNVKNNDSFKYFLSDNGKLNVIVELRVPYDHGYDYTIIPVE